MMIKLFDVNKSKDIIPTEHCYTIKYLKDIIDTYGETNAGKIFAYFHYMHSMNPDENPFYNLPDNEKKEVIVRNVIPPKIDVEDELIEEGLSLVKKLYETANYRLYKSCVKLKDKLAETLSYAYVSLSKEDGNTKELKSAIDLEAALNERTKVAFKEMMDEMGVTESWGGRKRNKYAGGLTELE